MPTGIPTTAAASVGVSPAPQAVAQPLTAVHAAARLEIDIRWLLHRQEELLGKELAVRDYSALVAAVARHRVNTPQIEVGSPDAYWRTAALLEQIVLLRPLPARNEYFGYGVAVACIRDRIRTLARPRHRHPCTAPDRLRHRRPTALHAPGRMSSTS
ncbi:hypothetical protein [Streptomyces mirabilis]|uniref:hypothetical protein n=1 Tax=Streptomyces mirabilis TaxID=68239 RepID=UPI003F68A5CE